MASILAPRRWLLVPMLVGSFGQITQENTSVLQNIK